MSLARALPGLALTATAAACLIPGYVAMFTGFQPYDDAGHLVSWLRAWARGAVLYDEVPVYGPAYFQIVTSAFGLLDVPITHGTTRAATLLAWTAVSAACGALVQRLTASLVVALGAQLLVFRALTDFRNEPLHPATILCLFIAAAIAAVCWLPARPLLFAALAGALAGTAALMKVNVGLFMLVAVVVTLALMLQAGRWTRLLRAAIVVGLPLAAPVGMAAGLGNPSVRALAIVWACAALAVGLTLACLARPVFPARALPVAALGFGAAAAFWVALALARGTGTADLLNSVLLVPLRLPGLSPAPLAMSSWAPGLAVGSLLGCVLFLLARTRGWLGPTALMAVTAVLHACAGAVMWAFYAGRLGLSPFETSLPLLWIVVAPGPAGVPPATAPGRALLATSALAQALHVYPVAGSQVAWASFLLIPAGGLALAAARRALDTLRARQPGASRRRWRAVDAVVGSLVLAMFLKVGLLNPWVQFKGLYDASVPLGLPGAENVRVSPRQAADYKLLVGTLSAGCTRLVTLPGMPSFHLFTGSEPIGELNSPIWAQLLTLGQQTRIRDRLEREPGRTCVLRNRRLVFFWSRGREVDGVLVRYIDSTFVTTLTVGDYELMVRRDGHAAARP
jgi:hypothetical protein